MEYNPPVDDIVESLKCAGAEALPYWDEEFARQIAGHFSRFAREELAPLNAPGDLAGCRLESGRVSMPDGCKLAYAQLAEQGWQGLTAPEAYGGQGLSAVHLAITSEIFSGANHALQMITGLVPGAIRTLLQYGTEDQQARFIPRLASGEMLATMCLTESAAGSDLARVRAKAHKRDEHWQITGEKIFISGGDQDISDDILHLVLARTSPDGLKGLSLFAVVGRVKVIRLEEKMGLHASPTCQLAFDGQRAELLGQEGAGLLAMFTLMNHARIDVALQGVAHASRATAIARRYANERVQGQVQGQDAYLAEHADVQRMIDRADSLAKSARAITHLALVTMERGDNAALVDFLTPLAKVYASKAGMRAAELSMQVLGGYGYLHEYGVEQIYRDARITAIYEGANGIHTRALATRGIKTGAAEAFRALLKARLGDESEVYQHWLLVYQAVSTSLDAQPLAKDFYQISAEALNVALASGSAWAQNRSRAKVKMLHDIITAL